MNLEREGGVDWGFIVDQMQQFCTHLYWREIRMMDLTLQLNKFMILRSRGTILLLFSVRQTLFS